MTASTVEATPVVPEVGARSVCWHALAVLFQHPDRKWADAVREGKLMDALEEAVKAMGRPDWLELISGLKRGFDSQARSLQTLSEDHVLLFGSHGPVHCPPFATEFGQRHVFSKAQDLADISGFYKAFGLQISTVAVDRADHICCLLEFLSFLALKQVNAISENNRDGADVTRDAEKKFLCEYVINWVPVFCEVLSAKARSDFFRMLAVFTREFVEAEEKRFGVSIPRIALPKSRGEPQDQPCSKCPSE